MNVTITTLEKFGLGLVRDGSVILRQQNPLWDEAARFEIDRLNIGIGCTGFSFYHIGSTSISTICAKPILDLLILVPSLAEIDQYKESFEALGYEYKKNTEFLEEGIVFYTTKKKRKAMCIFMLFR